MAKQMYNVYFEYGDRGDGKPSHEEYNDVFSIGGGVKGALLVALKMFYGWYPEEVEITKVVIEKVKTK